MIVTPSVPGARDPSGISAAEFGREGGGFAWLASVLEELEAPGFIRRFTFADGPHYTLLALWHTAADAHAFFSSDEHQAAMGDLFRHRWQYSHFAALWELTTPRERVIFCQQCEGVTPATEGVCRGCGDDLFDPFSIPSQVDG